MDINSNNVIWDFVSQYSINGLIEECSLYVNTENQSEFSYYPNPIENLFKINNQSNDESIIVFDLTGKSVYESRLVKGYNIFDISAFKPGLYNVKIGAKIFKILKK